MHMHMQHELGGFCSKIGVATGKFDRAILIDTVNICHIRVRSI